MDQTTRRRIFESRYTWQSDVLRFVLIQLSDVAVAGSKMRLEASPSLADIARKVASSIAHPTDTNRTLWDMRGDEGPFSGPIASDVQHLFDSASKASSSTGVGALGSGSDYTVRPLFKVYFRANTAMGQVFLQHIGVSKTTYHKS